MKLGLYFCTILLALTITGLKAQIICEENEVIPRAIPVFEELQQNFNNVQKFGCHEIDPNESAEQKAYRHKLEFQKTVSQNFFQLNNPALKDDLNYYTEDDSQLHFFGHEYPGTSPRTWNDFYNFSAPDYWNEQPYGNRRIVDDLKTSLRRMGPGKNFLTRDESRALTEKAIRLDGQVTQKLLEEKGNCYLRAMNISHEIASKYPSVPVVKVWLMGDFSYGGQKWPYHVAAFAPVLKNGYSESGGRFYRSLKVLPQGIFKREGAYFKVKSGYSYSREHNAYYRTRLFRQGVWVNESEALVRINFDPRSLKVKTVEVPKSEAIALQSLEPLNSRGRLKAEPQDVDDWVAQFLFQQDSGIQGPVKLKLSYGDRLAPSKCVNSLYNCQKNKAESGRSYWDALSTLSRSR